MARCEHGVSDYGDGCSECYPIDPEDFEKMKERLEDAEVRVEELESAIYIQMVAMRSSSELTRTWRDQQASILEEFLGGSPSVCTDHGRKDADDAVHSDGWCGGSGDSDHDRGGRIPAQSGHSIDAARSLRREHGGPEGQCLDQVDGRSVAAAGQLVDTPSRELDHTTYELYLLGRNVAREAERLIREDTAGRLGQRIRDAVQLFRDEEATSHHEVVSGRGELPASSAPLETLLLGQRTSDAWVPTVGSWVRSTYSCPTQFDSSEIVQVAADGKALVRIVSKTVEQWVHPMYLTPSGAGQRTNNARPQFCPITDDRVDNSETWHCPDCEREHGMHRTDNALPDADASGRDHDLVNELLERWRVDSAFCFMVRGQLARLLAQVRKEERQRSETAEHRPFGGMFDRLLLAQFYQAVQVLRSRCSKDGTWGTSPADAEIDRMIEKFEATRTGGTPR